MHYIKSNRIFYIDLRISYRIFFSPLVVYIIHRHEKRLPHWSYYNPIGLKDVLNNAGFTIESILNNDASKIAQDLGIDEYVGQIIFKETKRKFESLNSFWIVCYCEQSKLSIFRFYNKECVNIIF